MTFSHELNRGEATTRFIGDRTTARADRPTRKMTRVAGAEQADAAKKIAFRDEWRDSVEVFVEAHCKVHGGNKNALTKAALELAGEATNWGEKPVTQSVIVVAISRAKVAARVN